MVYLVNKTPLTSSIIFEIDAKIGARNKSHVGYIDGISFPMLYK